ncbi:DOMON domain protein [Ancylostoma caninum]|uniref:DOMON domain protein n=1 Tax=Ancylostoma caninum TaxID=29170 RepID=A0A368FVR3_ANCCA|nr:DOMON domain protein [Ancylostoma caninum]
MTGRVSDLRFGSHCGICWRQIFQIQEQCNKLKCIFTMRRFTKNQFWYLLIASVTLTYGKGTFNNATCGTKKGCFISSEPNGMAVSYEVLSPASIRFELTMKTSATSSLYLAVGFSKDDKMGLDNVIECSALTGQALSMKFSYNPALRNARIPGEETIRSQYFKNETAVISDGMMYCAATVDVSGWGPSNGQVFTYKENQRYFLLLAAGSAITSGNLSIIRAVRANAWVR